MDEVGAVVDVVTPLREFIFKTKKERIIFMYENLTYAELKRMLKNDDLWHFIEIVMSWPFDESSLNYFLQDNKKETPEYILILDAFFQTGRDIIIHWNNLPKGGQLEQLKKQFTRQYR